MKKLKKEKFNSKSAKNKRLKMENIEELSNSIILENFPYRIEIISKELMKQGLFVPKKEILKRLKIEEDKRKSQELKEKAEAKKEVILPCNRKASELFGEKCWHNRCYLKEKCQIFERR